jgi:hypothetical protein
MHSCDVDWSAMSQVQPACNRCSNGQTHIVHVCISVNQEHPLGSLSAHIARLGQCLLLLLHLSVLHLCILLLLLLLLLL